MKLRLPRSLALGIMAVTCAVSAGAETTSNLPFYNIIDDVVPPTKGETVTWSTVEEDAKFVAKDGEGTLKYTGNGTISSTIYAREGEIQIGDGATETTVSINPTNPDLGASVYGYGVNAGGKDGTLRINKATVTSGFGSTVVGGQNGNGTMIVENSATYNAAGSEVFVIGDTDYSTGTTKAEDETTTPTEENRDSVMYKGTYSPAKNGSEASFGRGDVIVKGGSTLATPRSFWMSEGSLTVTGKDENGNASTVTVGNSTNGNRALMGVSKNSTSEINVTDGGQLDISVNGEFLTNYSSNTNTIIKVDGKGSTLTVNTPRYSDFGNGNQGATNTNTTVEVTGGATAYLNSKWATRFGDKSNSSDTVKSELKVGADSTVVAYYLMMCTGSSLENEGTIEVDPNKWLKLEGNATAINNGTIKGDTWLSAKDVSLTLGEGSQTGGVYITEGSLIVDGNADMTGILKRYQAVSNAEIIFTLNSSLDMGGNLVTIDGINIVLEVDSSITSMSSLPLGQALFTNYAEDSSINSDSLVTVRYADGTVLGTTTLGQLIPEPTTATLSLMALAGLCARRRRK